MNEEIEDKYLVVGYTAEGYHSGKEKTEVLILDQTKEEFGLLYDILESDKQSYYGLDGKHSEVEAKFFDSTYIEDYFKKDILSLEDLNWNIKKYCKKYNYDDAELEKLLDYAQEQWNNTKYIKSNSVVKTIMIITDKYGNELYNNSK